MSGTDDSSCTELPLLAIVEGTDDLYFANAIFEREIKKSGANLIARWPPLDLGRDLLMSEREDVGHWLSYHRVQKAPPKLTRRRGAKGAAWGLIVSRAYFNYWSRFRGKISAIVLLFDTDKLPQSRTSAIAEHLRIQANNPESRVILGVPDKFLEAWILSIIRANFERMPKKQRDAEWKLKTECSDDSDVAWKSVVSLINEPHKWREFLLEAQFDEENPQADPCGLHDFIAQVRNHIADYAQRQMH